MQVLTFQIKSLENLPASLPTEAVPKSLRSSHCNQSPWNKIRLFGGFLPNMHSSTSASRIPRPMERQALVKIVRDLETQIHNCPQSKLIILNQSLFFLTKDILSI